MKLRLLVAAIAVAVLQTQTQRASADYVLDNFSNPVYDYQISRPNSSPYTTTDAVGPGISRTITVTVTTPVPPNFNSASGFIGGGQFSLDTDNASRANAEVRYTLTGAARDLGSATGLALTFAALNPGNISNPTPAATNIPVTIVVSTATGNRTLETAISSSTTFDFGSFTGTGDLTQVNSISILLNGSNSVADSRLAVDFSLTGVKTTAVPAPPAVLLAGFGVLALLGRARLTRRPTAVV